MDGAVVCNIHTKIFNRASMAKGLELVFGGYITVDQLNGQNEYGGPPMAKPKVK